MKEGVMLRLCISIAFQCCVLLGCVDEFTLV